MRYHRKRRAPGGLFFTYGQISLLVVGFLVIAGLIFLLGAMYGQGKLGEGASRWWFFWRKAATPTPALAVLTPEVESAMPEELPSPVEIIPSPSPTPRITPTPIKSLTPIKSPTPSVAAISGEYYLQVIAYSHAESANRMAEKLQSLDYSARVVTAKITEGAVYRVIVEGFTTFAQAVRAGDKIVDQLGLQEKPIVYRKK